MKPMQSNYVKDDKAIELIRSNFSPKTSSKTPSEKRSKYKSSSSTGITCQINSKECLVVNNESANELQFVMLIISERNRSLTGDEIKYGWRKIFGMFSENSDE